MKKIFILSNQLGSLLNFRSELIATLSKSNNVFMIAPEPMTSENIRTAEKLGANYLSVNMSRKGMNPFSDLRLLIEFVSILRKHKPDVIMLCRIKPVIWGGLAARLTRTKCVPLITGLGYTFISVESIAKKLLHKVVKMLYKTALKRSHVTLFQNPDDQRLFSHLSLTDGVKTDCINGSGVNCNTFDYSPVNCDQPINFLMTSRLLKEKGIEEFCDAVESVSKKYPEATFSLVGFFDGSIKESEQKRLELRIQSLPIQFYGKLDDVRPAIKKCSVFVLPSYREGVPRASLEAMSMGRAIITTDVPGCRETVSDGINGLLVKPRDPISLANAMTHFITEPECIFAMGIKSRKMALERFNVHDVNNIIMKHMLET